MASRYQLVRDINLAAAIASFCGLFGLFFLKANSQNRTIRHYSLQSIALDLTLIIVMLIITLLTWLSAGIPVLSAVFGVIFWLTIILLAAAFVYFHCQMTEAAYNAKRYALPLIGGFVERKFD